MFRRSCARSMRRRTAAASCATTTILSLLPDGTNAHFIDPTIDISDEIECGPRLGEDLLEAEDDSGAFKLVLETEDDLVALEECRYMISRPICLCGRTQTCSKKACACSPVWRCTTAHGSSRMRSCITGKRKYGLVRL